MSNQTPQRFIDAHIHLWELKRIHYPWLTPPFSDDGPNGSVEPIAHDYTLDNYFADAKGFNVNKVVHIDAGANPADAILETRWLQQLADNTGFPNAIVGFAALNEPNVEHVLAQHIESRNVRGIRHIINWHPDPKRTYTPRDLLNDAAFARGYGLLKKFKLSFDLQIYPGQMAGAYGLIKANPDTQVIINHMGMPVDDDKSTWKNGLAMLASLPNVAIKVSGFGFIKRNWALNDIKPLVEYVLECFGTHRVMFASDFPTDKLFNSFSQSMQAYAAIVEHYSATERDNLFAANAERIYRI
jgi:predicted TIM-barrel fold metal-dependent hydrolase